MTTVETVNRDLAAQILNDLWEEYVVGGADTSVEADISARIDEIMESGEKTFGYILANAALAKSTNNSINTRALQSGSSLKGAYDARSLAHKVLVPFEYSKGNLFGMSREPFVNKPARHMEHDKKNAYKNKKIASVLHDLLEVMNSMDCERSKNILAYILKKAEKRGSEIAGSVKKVDEWKDNNLISESKLNSVIEGLLAGGTSGAGLQAIVACLMGEIYQDMKVVTYPANQPDIKKIGDVEVKDDAGRVVIAVDCKEKTLSISHANQSIESCSSKGVSKLIFVTIDESYKVGVMCGSESNLDIGGFSVKTFVDSLMPTLSAQKRYNMLKSLIHYFANDLNRADIAELIVNMIERDSERSIH